MAAGKKRAVNEADKRLWNGWRKRRDDDAFETLVRPHLAFLGDFARRLGLKAADADDLVQQALAGLATEKSNRPLHVGLRPWLGRSLVLQSKMLRRSAARRTKHEQAVLPATGAASDPVESREEVEAFLRGLPEPQRQAIVLRYLHDMDYEDIAYVTGASINACRLRVHKGIETMRSRAGRQVGALVAALPLLGHGSEAGLVKSALAAGGGAGATVAAAGGLLAMKKTAVTAAVLVGVAGSFYLLGGSMNESAGTSPRTDTPPEVAVADGPRNEAESGRVASKEPNSEADAEPAKPAAGAEHVHKLQEALGGQVGGHGLVAFGIRAQYLNGELEWHALDSKLPNRVPTGFRVPGPGALALIPQLASLTDVYELNLRSSDLSDADLARLAHLRTMVKLSLSRTKVTDAGLEHLLGMSDLRSLGLHDTAITDEGLRTIGRLTSLTSLDVHDTKITDEGLAHLRGLVNLQSIRFFSRRITEAALVHLAHFPKLEDLSLADMPLTEVGLEQVAKMSSIRALRIEDFRPGSLRGLRGASQLEALNLSDAKVTGAELEHLADLKRLRILNLGETSVDASGLEHLAGLTALEWLNLDETRLDDDSLAHLASLERLTFLRLDKVGMTDAGVKHLAGLTSLERLDIDENQITDAAIPHLVGLINLEYLDLKDTQVTPEGVRKLQQALPGCKIRLP